MKMKYIYLIKEKNYLKILIAGIINRFGDSIDVIAMSWLIYWLTENSFLTVLNFGINYLPTVLIQPFAGVVVEFLNHKKVIVFMDFLRGVVVLGIALLTCYNCLNGWMILVATFLLSTAEAFRMPANQALFPNIVSKQKYSDAIALQNSLYRLTEFVGMSISGIIIGLFGIFVAVFIDAITFVISGFIILSINSCDGSYSMILDKEIAHELKIGFLYMWKRKNIINYCLLGILSNFLLIPMNSLQTVLCVDYFHMGAELLSFFGIFITLGTAIGAFVYPYIEKYYKSIHFIIILFMSISMFYAGVVIDIIFIDIKILFYFVLGIITFVFGFSVAIINTHLSVNIFKFVDKCYLARVSSVLSAISTSMIPVGSVIISIMSINFSVNVIFVFIALLSIIFMILYIIENSIRGIE